MKYLLYDIDKKKIREYEKNDVIDELYFLKAKLPTQKELNESKYKIKVSEIKNAISKIDNKVPLYDIISENMFIIDKYDVYTRVRREEYRFPDEKLYLDLKLKKKELNRLILNNKLDPTETILKKRIVRKIDQITEFLDSFNLQELENTYIRVFYFYTEEGGKNITQCLRPSFTKLFTHITAYYKKAEIINLAKNMELENKCKDNDKDKYDTNSDKLLELCQKVKQNDVSWDILLKHQEHMIKENKVGLIQYYTLHGSYIMNKYLRNLETNRYKNVYLESLIKPMWNLISNAPEFDKEYILYRFIQNDDNLRLLEIGDLHQDNGFTSTTRDPFYRSDLYKFGFILVKIKIPSKTKGVGLCVETLSHFPEEQEVILGPKCILRLDKKDNKCKYYHTDEKYTLKVTTRYEFTYISNDSNVQFDTNLIEYEKKNEIVDFINIKNKSTHSLEEKIRLFMENYVNPMHQCEVKISDKVFTIFNEYYDSTSVYRPYYAIETPNGFSMYCIYNNYVLFFIELGEDNNQRTMHVNYYTRYSTLDRNKIISDEDFILFISKIGYYFEIPQARIHNDFKACNSLNIKNTGLKQLKQRGFNKERFYKGATTPLNNINDTLSPIFIESQATFGGIYCVDFYEYLKSGYKRYKDIKLLSIEIAPAFAYYQLDKLKHTNPLSILRREGGKEDNDELYQIYMKVYKGKDNLNDFYLWIIENRCYLIFKLTEKMHRLYSGTSLINPFDKNNSFYTLDTNSYLYNRGYIKNFPDYFKNETSDFKRGILNANKNEYRLANYK